MIKSQNKRKKRRFPLASSWGKKSKETREKEKDPTNWMELDSFCLDSGISIEFE